MNILIDGQTLETEEINRGIGVYFKNVLANMVRDTTGNIWYITISNAASIAKLDRWTASRLNPIISEVFTPSYDYENEIAFTETINKIVKQYHIDCIWIPNPLMINVLFPATEISCPCYTTVYDLIPDIMPIKEWSEHITKEYYRRIEYLKSINLICISSATEQDLKKRLGGDIHTDVVMLAADEKTFYRQRESLNDTDTVNIVFTGGFDYRKNIEGAIEAFAQAKMEIKDKQLKFYIVCKYNFEEKKCFDKKLHELNIYENVYLTGFIPDEKLAELYYTADVFFFPSFYEGFGLPLLEAMLGGAYILSADNSSLPEVCGEYALYCDANNIKDMTEKLVLAVCNSSNETLQEKQKRQEYALHFSWKKTAKNTYAILERTTSIDMEGRKKIAMVTPWPKQQTGIANYVYRLMPFLNQYFDVDIFADNTLDQECELLPNPYGGLYVIGELEKRYSEYDEIVYQLGNSTKYHSEVYRMFKKYNGIAEIHDFILHSFFFHSYYVTGEKMLYRQALIDGYGSEGELYYQDIEAERKRHDAVAYPMSCSISRIAQKTIVHNEWSYKQFFESGHVHYIPLSAFETDKLSINMRRKAESSLYKKIAYKKEEILIGCFGWVNENKRPEVVLKSVLQLKKMGYPVKLVYFGKSNFSVLDDLINHNWFKECVLISGYLERHEYQLAMELCDIVVNLRYPSMGEASGTLCEAFKAEKPVIVSATNQYLEFPDEVCWKLPIGVSEVETLAEMLRYLIDYPDVRSKLGENAKWYAENIINGSNIAKLYQQVLS